MTDPTPDPTPSNEPAGNERHPDAELINSETLSDLVLGSKRREPNPVGRHDMSGHGRYGDGPIGLTLGELRAGDVIVRRHVCGGIDWAGEPLTVTSFKWATVRGEHAIGLIGGDGIQTYDHAADWGLEAHGTGYTTVDTTEGSPTYMTEIAHPMCGRWSTTNFAERRPGSPAPSSDAPSDGGLVVHAPPPEIETGWDAPSSTPSDERPGVAYCVACEAPADENCPHRPAPSPTPVEASGQRVSLPVGVWDALCEAIDKATDPDQPLVGLADNLTSLLVAASAALAAADRGDRT